MTGEAGTEGAREKAGEAGWKLSVAPGGGWQATGETRSASRTPYCSRLPSKPKTYILPTPSSLFPTLHIRIAVSADLPAVVDLINAAFQVEQFFVTGERTSVEECAGLLDEDETCLLVAEPADSPGPLLGALVVRVRDTRGYFGMLSIAPGHQGRGLGRALVSAAENHCRRAGCETIEISVVDVRTELPAFYKPLGYRVTGTAPFPAPERLLRPAHFVLMSKPLTSGNERTTP